MICMVHFLHNSGVLDVSIREPGSGDYGLEDYLDCSADYPPSVHEEDEDLYGMDLPLINPDRVSHQVLTMLRMLILIMFLI